MLFFYLPHELVEMMLLQRLSTMPSSAFCLECQVGVFNEFLKFCVLCMKGNLSTCFAFSLKANTWNPIFADELFR